MKKIILFFTLILFIVLPFACSKELTRVYTKPGFSFANKKSIAVLNANVKSRRDFFLVRRNIITEIELQLKQKGFNVINQDQINNALKELNLPVDRDFNDNEIIKLKEKITSDILIQAFVSEDSETLISEDLNINFHFKYYDGSNGNYVAEALYQYKGSSSLLDAALIKTAVLKALQPLGIKD